jgi:hypothetical protein
MQALKGVSRYHLAVTGVTVAAVAVALGIWVSQTGRGIPAPPVALRPVLAQVARYVENRWRSPGARMFCGVRYLGNSPLHERFSLYVWEACQQYRVAGGRLVRGTGWSSAAVVSVLAVNGRYRVINEQEPVDYDEPDFSRMFPNGRVRSAIWSLDGFAGTGPGTPAAMFRSDERRARHALLHQ